MGVHISGEDKDENIPPKFSIGNGFAIGDLPPHLRDAKITQRRLTSLASFREHTVIAIGGRHKFIKSHVLVFSSQPDKIREGINKAIDNESKILLLLINPMTAEQKRMTMKRYEARRDKVNSLL